MRSGTLLLLGSMIFSVLGFTLLAEAQYPKCNGSVQYQCNCSQSNSTVCYDPNATATFTWCDQNGTWGCQAARYLLCPSNGQTYSGNCSSPIGPPTGGCQGSYTTSCT